MIFPGIIYLSNEMTRRNIQQFIENNQKNSTNNKIDNLVIPEDENTNLNELGENIKITTISNVEKNMLENCLKIIFESNQDIIFKAVKYSESEKKVYFYTNNPIDTKKWEEGSIGIFKIPSNIKEILIMIKNIFDLEEPLDKESISLYEVLLIYKTLYKEEMSKKLTIKNKITSKIKNALGEDCYCMLCPFDYDTNEQEIIIVSDKRQKEYKYCFKKENDLLCIRKIKPIFAKTSISQMFLKEMEELYEYCISLKEQRETLHSIKSTNTAFSVDFISDCGINIYFGTHCYLSLFSVEYYSYKDEPDINLPNDLPLINSEELEFLKKIYVKIEDCPEWLKPMLYEIRTSQLKNTAKTKKKIPN